MEKLMKVRSVARLALVGLVAMAAGSTMAAEGNTTPNSRVPVAGIVNPAPGVVTRPFRVQVRVFSPKALDNVTAQPILATSRLYFTGPVSGNVQLIQNTKYNTVPSTETGIWEASLTAAQLTAVGTYTLYATINNATGSVNTGNVVVTVKATAGDGNLLVRDNSSQLCSDCHEHKTHSSETMGAEKYGSWFTGCRTCHQPHGTTNASLIANSITPPSLTATPETPKTVVFSRRSGYVATGGASNAGAASYANGDGTGVCQVCHTRTPIFKRTDLTAASNTSATHTADRLSQPCGNCHRHTAGMKASCNGCHGSAANDAPPVVSQSPNPVTEVFVAGGGVHQQHLTQTQFRTVAVSCPDCHATMDAPHPNDITSVSWGAVATGNGTILLADMVPNGSVAGWTTAPTCTNWCHGATLSDAVPPTKDAVSWGTPLTLDCGSCHGFPPSVSPHTVAMISSQTGCNGCHPPGYNPVLGIVPAEHIDGTIQAAGCNGCHGNPDRVVLNGSSTDVTNAPPKSVRVGSTISDATTAAGTGVHMNHVNVDTTLSTTIASPVACSECHNVVDTTHPETTNGPGEVTWGTLANKLGTAAWNGTTCTTYCHSPSTQAGSLPSPSWATTTTVTCTSCHQTTTLNTGGHEMHLVDSSYKGTTYGCATCHDGATNTAIVNAKLAQHVDGTKDVSAGGWVVAGTTCSTNACHSDGTETSPYKPINWNSGTAASGGTCTECHGSDATNAFTPGWGEPNYTNNTASPDTRNSHMKHVSRTQATAKGQCINCHFGAVTAAGVPVAGVHLNNPPKVPTVAPNTAAGISFTYDASAETCSSISCHANKNATWGDTLSCNSCHGQTSKTQTATNVDPNWLGAPPVDAAGLSTGLKVGEHYKHTAGTTFRRDGLLCTDCHQSADLVAGGHDGTLDAAWSTLATGTGVDAVTPTPLAGQSAYNNWTSPYTCTNYCHGASLLDGNPATKLTAQWNGTQTFTCGSCHGFPPDVSPHTVAMISSPTGCNGCHPAGYNPVTGAIPVEHIDGTVQAAGCDGCHGNSARTVLGASSPDVKFAPPKSVRVGSTISDLTTAAGTGVHQNHVNFDNTLATAISMQVACSECHNVVDTSHPETANGPGEVTWGPLANKLGTAAWNGTSCTTYCHSPSTQAGSLPSPSWATTTTVTCTSCHQTTALNTGAHEMHVADTSGYKGESYTCIECHDTAASNTAIANAKLAQHVNGTAEYTASACGTCHNDAKRAPTVVTPAWTTGTEGGTCIECHGREAGSVAGAPWYANGGNGTNTANSHQNHLNLGDSKAACYWCHNTTVSSTGVIQPAVHLDTTAGIEVSSTFFTWNSGTETCSNITCHGTTPNTAVWGSTTNIACVTCHLNTTGGTPIVRGTLGTPAGTNKRRDVVSEFKQTWSHKASTNVTPASRTVVDADCIVCHMEGDKATLATSSSHANGYLNLRNPDTGLNIRTVSFNEPTSAATPGSYNEDAGADAAPAQFARNLGSNAIESDAAAIMVNQCLKCHDGDGALSTDARVGTAIAGKPFNTTIAGTGYAGSTGNTACATGTDGCVVNVEKAFVTTNASYHPILGKQNNSYMPNTLMVTPWNTLSPAKTPGNITTGTNMWGFRMTCWDCHAGAAASGPQTMTVTAHGGAATIRQAVWSSSSSATNNLCKVCHNVSTGTTGHGAGSAAATVNSRAGAYMNGRCYFCHLSAQAKPARPVPAEDVHGFNRLLPNSSTDTMWPMGAASNTFRPYTFMRNTVSFSGTGSYMSPLSVPAGETVPAARTCGGGTFCGRSSHGTYTPGGVY
jgi:predicted CxxxxCH...CXXCH cytochrome family protein